MSSASVVDAEIPYALRFISGKYQGGEFPLRMDREIVIGRSSELDMVLVEDMVSRKHAKISTQAGQILIQDLGSTNGTFVNGEKISGRAQLSEGDRILVGTSIIKVVAVEGAALDEAEARRQLEAGANRQMTSGRPMSGVIEEIPLPDLLQLLSTSRKSGVLAVSNAGQTGKIYMRKGQIYFAAINDDFAVNPLKAIYRMLTWTNGTFELEPSIEMVPLRSAGASPLAPGWVVGPVPSVGAGEVSAVPQAARMMALPARTASRRARWRGVRERVVSFMDRRLGAVRQRTVSCPSTPC